MFEVVNGDKGRDFLVRIRPASFLQKNLDFPTHWHAYVRNASPETIASASAVSPLYPRRGNSFPRPNGVSAACQNHVVLWRRITGSIPSRSRMVSYFMECSSDWAKRAATCLSLIPDGTKV